MSDTDTDTEYRELTAKFAGQTAERLVRTAFDAYESPEAREQLQDQIGSLLEMGKTLLNDVAAEAEPPYVDIQAEPQP